MKGLYAALAKAQVEFKEPKKTKKAYNYMYAPMEEIRKAVIDALHDHGLTVIQFPINNEDRVGVRTTLAHESGDAYTVEFTTKLPKTDPQSIGSAITYFRRYAMMAVLGLAPEDDDGESAMPKKVNKQPIAQKMPDDIGEQVINGGKWKGIKVKDVPEDDAMGYISWADDNNVQGPAKYLSDMFHEYFNKQ